MMSHSRSSVMLFTEMDLHHQQPAEGDSSISGLGSLPKDVSQGLDLSLFENINNDEIRFDLFNDTVEEGRNGSGVGVDEAAGQDDDVIDDSVLNWALGSMKHDLSLDHDYDGKSERVNELIDSNAENDNDESQSRSGGVSSPHRVVIRSQRPKRAATLKKRTVSICSDSSEEMDSPKTRQPSGDRSMSKNAIAARENREKKKQYVSNLERRNKMLEETNERMRSEIDTCRRSQEAMVNEIRYLRGCLANSPEISAVIRSVLQIPGLKQVTTSIGINSKNQESRNQKNQESRNSNQESRNQKNQESRKRCLRSNDEENASPKSRRLQPLTGADKAGICVHVNDGAVSLEFCSQCSKSAKIASKR